MKKPKQFWPKAATKAAKLAKLAAFVFPTTFLIKKGEGGQWLSGLSTKAANTPYAWAKAAKGRQHSAARPLRAACGGGGIRRVAGGPTLPSS